MTSKERILLSLNKKIPDRVPISTYELDNALNPDTWENKQPSYKKLMDFIREKVDFFYPVSVDLVNPYIKSHTFTEKRREGKSTFYTTTLITPKGDLKQVRRVDDDINTSWELEPLLKTDEDLEKYMSIPDTIEKPDCSKLKDVEKLLGDRGVLFIGISDPICIAAELFEFGEFTVRAITQKENIIKLLDKIFSTKIEYLKEILQQVKGRGYVFRIVGPEYATPPYLSPDFFHEFVCKYDSQFIKLIKEAGCFSRIHCHGKVAKVLDHMLEMEPDALDPLEAPPSGDITLKEVKEKIGKKICLVGNIQLRDLEYSTESEMEKIVINCMDSAKEGGGYIIVPTACPINIPLSSITERNYFIFIETALRYGRY